MELNYPVLKGKPKLGQIKAIMLSVYGVMESYHISDIAIIFEHALYVANKLEKAGYTIEY